MVKVTRQRLNIRWEIGREGKAGALVIRWIGCSLGCGVCYVSHKDADPNISIHEGTEQRAVKQVESWLNKNPAIHVRTRRKGYIRWARIQGGEPLLYKERAIATVDLAERALAWMLEQAHDLIPRVVIQTNGIWFATASDDDIIDVVERMASAVERIGRGRICIEVSFKGPNPEITEKYALARRPELKGMNVFDEQIRGFKRLREAILHEIWGKGITRVAIYPIAGFGPCLKGFIPVDDTISEHDVYPLFHPKTWDPRFKHVIDIFKQDLLDYGKTIYKGYLESLKKHFNGQFLVPMETMEPTPFQRGWTAYLKRDKLIANFARKYIRITDIHQSSLRMFMNDIAGILQEIPIEYVREKIQEVYHYFYHVMPEKHYPYL